MRHLNAKRNPSSYKDDPKFEDLMRIAIEDRLGLEEETDLLNAIRNGKSDLIDRLVASSEIIILKVIRQYAPESENLHKMIEIGKTALYKLAENEINNSGRERFLRFRALYIKQAVLEV